MATHPETLEVKGAQQAVREKNLESKDQRTLEVSYLQKQIAAYEAYREMMAAEKNTDEYKKLKETWLAKRKEVEDEEERFKENIEASTYEKYISNYNLSEAKAQKRLKELGGSVQSVKEQDQAVEQTTSNQNDPEGAMKETSSVKENWRSLWALGPGDRLPDNVTEADVKKHIEMVGKSQGKETLAYAYAKSLLENLNEEPVREQAEEHRDEVAEAEAEEKQLQEQLRAEKNRKVAVLEEPNDKVVTLVEREVKNKAEQVEEKKKEATWGSKFKTGVASFFNKFKKTKKTEEKKIVPEKVDNRTPEEKIASGEEYLDESGFIHNKKEGGFLSNEWLNERAKGFVGGFGWWESHQAEKFRRGTKEMGRDAKAQVKLLEQEAGIMDFETAREEGAEIEKRMANLKVQNKAAYERLSGKISREKQEYNQKTEDKIVALAMAKLEQKIGGKEWFEAYKAANGGRALTPEKSAELEKLIREKIGELRNGQAKKDLVDFVKLSRQSLDKNYWHRYIYTAVDAVLAGLLLKWVVGKYLGGKAAEVVTGKGGAEKVLEHGMKDHVWGETKRFLVEKGVDPTDSNVLKYAKMVAQDSGVAVKEWGLNSGILDTQMPGGYLLKFTRVAAELAKLGF